MGRGAGGLLVAWKCALPALSHQAQQLPAPFVQRTLTLLLPPPRAFPEPSPMGRRRSRGATGLPRSRGARVMGRGQEGRREAESSTASLDPATSAQGAVRPRSPRPALRRAPKGTGFTVAPWSRIPRRGPTCLWSRSLQTCPLSPAPNSSRRGAAGNVPKRAPLSGRRGGARDSAAASAPRAHGAGVPARRTRHQSRAPRRVPAPPPPARRQLGMCRGPAPAPGIKITPGHSGPRGQRTLKEDGAGGPGRRRCLRGAAGGSAGAALRGFRAGLASAERRYLQPRCPEADPAAPLRFSASTLRPCGPHARVLKARGLGFSASTKRWTRLCAGRGRERP
ncbi:hypothetical protein P7K49_012191 [Saguinus oedipus]|uniref:Uncharacterized protein n=1 Tax=Saguinus oedipus TaxID=9490 RepID=A0ABQ9VSU0_SAGOE|nr:hypothetical protein P7K49_012191 [Saguinus oedipus]